MGNGNRPGMDVGNVQASGTSTERRRTQVIGAASALYVLSIVASGVISGQSTGSATQTSLEASRKPAIRPKIGDEVRRVARGPGADAHRPGHRAAQADETFASIIGTHGAGASREGRRKRPSVSVVARAKRKASSAGAMSRSL